MLSCILALLVSASAALPVVPPTAGGTKSSPSSARVRVWDNVLPDDGDMRAALREYSVRSGPLGHRCFSRPLLADDNRYSIIERTLDAILTEIERGGGNDDSGGDGRMIVEYWTRREWRHIEAHADVDENLSKRLDRRPPEEEDSTRAMQSKYPTTYLSSHGHRYPIFGHVLYLQIGTDVRGPTCIFPGRTTGGELLRTTASDTKSDSADLYDGPREVQLSIVPAVTGRLLRFDGRDLHAVPRPTDIWMIPFVRGSPEYEPREVWGRSVILFNVWPRDEDPPLDIPLDMNEDDSRRCQAIDVLCNPFDDWNEVNAVRRESIPSIPSDSQSNQSVKVWLLGNERRRDHPLRTVSLLAPADGGRDAVREALNEKIRVTDMWLRQS
ncbi:hypothetical protein ACHAXA_000441 [Cyclostephanos tholiformis]|uniref:Fe2OG dioxygenase domain-containing protein n=1 Tax=Cyclostephanos tholiformis TaxID=382380 RepID=A0ABD3RVX6_9STRA